MAGRVLMLVENLSVPFDRRVWKECRVLADAGYDVTVICPRGDGVDGEPYRDLHGVRIHRYVPRWSNGAVTSYGVEYAFALSGMLRLAIRLARRRPFDVVHAASPPDLLFLIALLLGRQGTRFVFDHHDLSPELVDTRIGPGAGFARRLALFLERASFAVADLVVSTNESYRQVALERGRVPFEKTVVVRNNPDPARWDRSEADDSLRRGKTHLLCYLGIMGPQDGVDYAIRAVSLLRESGRNDFHLALLGDGDAKRDCVALVRRLGLDDCVEFTGVADDAAIRRYLSTADVCLSPEPKTRFNDASTMTKILEYMAMSVPIVAFDLAETRYSAGEAAAYAMPNDERDFARLIAELLDDPNRRAAMGSIGRRRVVEHFSWEQSRSELLRAYERLLIDKPSNKRRARPRGVGIRRAP